LAAPAAGIQADAFRELRHHGGQNRLQPVMIFSKMHSRIRYEFSRLFSLKTLPIFLLFFMASLFLVNSGILEYKSFLNDLDIDIDIEYQKQKLFASYDQYSIIGYRALLKPSPLIIFFHTSNMLKNIESNIDTREMVGIFANSKGSEIFKKGKGFGDFSGFLNVFGSLLMTIYGLMTYKNTILAFNREKKFTRNVLIRMLILDLYFVLLMVSMYLYAVLEGILFSPHQGELYAVFCLAALLLLNSWFIMGAFFSLWLRYKGGRLAVITLWALVIIGIPEIRYLPASPNDIPSVKKTNLIKLKTLMETEKKIREKILPLLKEGKKDYQEIKQIQKQMVEDYMKNQHELNKKIEQELHHQVMLQVKRFENWSCFLPWSFYLVLGESISSKGYNAYIGFVDFVLDMRDGFFRYIIDRRYNSDDKQVIPYVKKGENVYHSKSVLPVNFWIGIFSIVITLLIFLLLSTRLFKKKFKVDGQASIPFKLNQLKSAKTFYKRCKDREEPDKYADCFRYHPEVAVVENISPQDYDPGVKLSDWVKFICSTEGFNYNEVQERLKVLEVPEADLQQRCTTKAEELLKKVYLVLKLSEGKDYYVLVNFFKGMSDDFVDLCRKLFARVPSRFLYLSSEKLRYSIVEQDKHPTDSENPIAIDWLKESIIIR
jgi:hypothetical protein